MRWASSIPLDELVAKSEKSSRSFDLDLEIKRCISDKIQKSAD